MKTVLRKYFFLLVMMLPASFGLVKAQPTFSSSPVTTATVGSPYTYAISATDPSNNPLTFTTITQPGWLTINSTGQSTASQFGSTVTAPGGIAGDDAGNIYVTNLAGTGVYKITPDGTTTLWFTRQAGYVYGMYVYNNDLFISYYTNNVSLKSKITKVNLSNPEAGETTVLTGANNSIYLSMTYYNGFMYIAAYGLNKVIKLDLNSGITTDVVNLISSTSGRPFGLGFNSAGLLYIASYTTGSLYTYNLSTSTLTQVLTGLTNPSDVKIDVNDNIYISGYKYVRKYTPNLISYVTAYTATSYVWGMSVTPTGALVFGDNAGHKVAKLQTGASLTGTPALSDIGNNSVTVRVSNGTTSTDQSYNIVVTGPPTIASLADITKTIGDAPFTITDPASNSAGTFSYSSSNTAVATISGNTVTITGAGIATITAVQAANANYSSGSTTALLTVTNNTPATGPAGINSGITMWLDASDIDADANAANDPATNSSLAIWKDKSGLAHNATTISGQNPVTFVTNQINGNPVAHFTRSTDFVGSALLANNVDIRSGINPEVTLFTVYKSAPLAGYQSIWGNDDGNWDRFFYNSWNSTNDGLVSLGGGNTVGITGAGTPGSLRLLTAVYKKSTLNGSAIYFNGAVVNRFTDNTDPLAALPNMGIGWDGDNGAFNGDIAEMIVYNRKLTDCEILQINQYLGEKYGVTFTSATITPSAAIAICQGATVTLTASTGDSYQWYKDGVSIPSAIESTYSATLSGTYTVAITTAGCTATSLGTVVTVNPSPTVTLSKADVACIGGNDGSITVTASNGTPPYQYSKDGGATYLSSNVFSGLTAGTYNIVVKPATGCISSAQSVTVSTVPDVTAPVMSGITNSVPSSILANVPEASQYQLVYKLPIPNSANWDAGSVIPYSVNNAAALAGINFGRVAYYMELDNKWVWVSMDKFTNNVALTGIPTGATLFQQNVNNMNVLASSNAGIVTGNNIATGNIELWSHCYATQNTASVPGASGSLYDFGDYVTTQDCYGSFQVHNYGAHQSLFAYNRWSNSGNSDLGIGNNTVVNQHPDWTYMTNAGNYANKNMYVFISSGIQDITANTDLGGCTATVAISTPQATDNCGVVTVTGVRSDNLVITAPYPTGNTTITWTAKDASNNASSTTQVVTVKDVTPPTFTTPAQILTPVNGSGEVVATGPGGAVVNYAIPSASDNCGSVTVVATPASGSMFPIGATTVTVTATDAANNSVQTSFVVTVSGLAPQIVCPANIEVNNTPGVCGANVPFAATETYGIPASTITYTEAGQPVISGSFFTVGIHTITATATNAVGSDVCTFTIIVKDNENPTFTPPVVTGTRTITIPYGQTCCWNSFVYNFTDPLPAGAVVTGIDLSYSGRDQGWGGTGDYNQLFVSGTYIGGNQYQHYTQAYTVNFAGAIPGYVYGGNNTFQMNFTGYPGWQGFFYGGPMTIHYKITSSNTNPPSIAANNNIGQCGAIVPLSIPVTADNCGVASVVNDAPSVFPVGTTTVTWTVTDIHGNKNTTTQSVTVTDNEKPTISIAAVSVNNDLGVCGATVNIGSPVTGDNCGIASVVNNHASNIYPVGATTVTWTVTDIHGNTNTTTQSITVTDNEKPTISIAPVSANNDLGACSATVNIGTPVTGDNCGVASVVNNHALNIYPVGTTTVIWTVTDIHGNQSTATQTITVTDNEVPTISSPVNIAVNNTAGICEATVNIGTPVTGDNCGVASVVNDHASNIYPVGTTTVTWTVTDIHGNTNTTTQTITVTDNELPTISIAAVSVNNDLGVCGATVNIGSPVTGDNCGIASVVNDHASNIYPVGTTTVTWTVTDIHSNTNSITQLVTVTDNEKPVITNPSARVNCANADGSTAYSIPAASATDNCGVASQSYAITGATTRGGTGYDASGVFNIGVSTIIWTVTDVHGNTSTGTTTVTINPLPVASYTTSNADAFCNQLTITASSSITPATYQWFSGSSTFANTQSISLGQTNGDGIYSVKVTDATTGCVSATAATYNFQKQTLASSYTILALEEVELGAYNKVNSGSVGVISAKGEAEFRSNSSVNSPGSFVKARKIESKGSNILITTPILSAATGITLPTMYYNTASTSGLSNKEVAKNSITTVSGNYKNLTLKKGSRTTLTGSVYGAIKVEQGAQVTFTQTTINIGKLHVVKGPRVGYSYVHFADGTKVLIGESVNIGSQVYMNPDNNNVTFYLSNKKKGDHDEEGDGKSFMIHGGDTRVTANIYMPGGKLKVKGGYGYGDYGKGKGDSDKEDDDEKDYGNGNSYVYMTGLFIAKEVESEGKNVIWNSFDCSSAPVPLVNTTIVAQSASIKNTEQPTTEEELKVTVMPNPSATYFTIKLESKYEIPVNMRVLDAGGRVIDAKAKIGSNSTFQVGHGYSSGTYFAELIQGSRRKVVQLVKARG